MWDRELMDHILGKSEAVQMKEAMSMAGDQNRPLEERVAALDCMEMLVERLDNAKDIERLRLWPAILEGLEQTEERLAEMHVWVVGTALQNNPVVQRDFMAHQGLTRLTGLGQRTQSARVASKLVYAFSGLTQNNPVSLSQFIGAGGIGMLFGFLLRWSEPALTHKILFLAEKWIEDSAMVSEWAGLLDLAPVIASREIDDEARERLGRIVDRLRE